MNTCIKSEAPFFNGGLKPDIFRMMFLVVFVYSFVQYSQQYWRALTWK